MSWIIPASVINGPFTVTVSSAFTPVAPGFELLTTTAALGIGGTVTLTATLNLYFPMADLSVFMDQAGSVQLAERPATTGTFRDVFPVALPVLASQRFELTGRRTVGQLRVTITNTSGVACLITEGALLVRAG